MTYDSQELLNLFGRLFQQRTFVAAAIKSNQVGDHQQNQRGQFRVLHLLAKQDNITNSDIVEALDIRPSSVSVLVSKLEHSGLIKRHNSSTDKRVSLITLTDKGRSFIESSRKFKDELSASMFESLTADEQQQLFKLLNKLTIDLESKEPQWQDLRGMDIMRHGFGPGFAFNKWRDHR